MTGFKDEIGPNADKRHSKVCLCLRIENLENSMYFRHFRAARLHNIFHSGAGVTVNLCSKSFQRRIISSCLFFPLLNFNYKNRLKYRFCDYAPEMEAAFHLWLKEK